MDDFNEASTLAPTRADVLIYRASAYRYLETYDLALEDIEAALVIRPESPEALLAPRSAAADAAQANLTMLDVNPKIDSDISEDLEIESDGKDSGQ